MRASRILRCGSKRTNQQILSSGFFALFLVLSFAPNGASPLLHAEDSPAPSRDAAAASETSNDAPEKRNKDAIKYDVNEIGHRNIGHGLNLYSIEKEQQLGQQLADQIDITSKLITDPVVTEYINRLGQTLVRHSDAQVPFTIKVIESDEINAFALPGGFFYVNTGLILAADNEAELAGLMAHEVAHVAARHATKAETRQQIWNVLSVPLLYFGGPAGMAVRSLAGVAGPMSFLKYTRDAEREADLLGVEYEYATGYDPHAFVEFFEKLHAREKQSHKRLSRAFATHPMTEDRIKRTQKEIATLLPPRPSYVIDTSEFEDVKARLWSLLESNHGSSGGKPSLRRHASDDSAPGKAGDDSGPVLHRHPSK